MFQTDTDRANLAMALDCEGSISLTAATDGGYAFQVTISNTSRELLEHLHSLAGGIGNINGPYAPANELNKLIYKWAIPHSEVISFLQAILPYLIVKRRQALLMIAMRSFFEHDIQTSFLSAGQLMSELNQEGNAGPGGGRPRKNILPEPISSELITKVETALEALKEEKRLKEENTLNAAMSWLKRNEEPDV